MDWTCDGTFRRYKWVKSRIKELSESVSNSFYILEDAAKFLRNELDDLEFDPERLNVIEDRLNEINQLKRKYGNTISAILEYGAKIEEEISTIQNKETHIDELQKRMQSLKKDLMIEGNELTNLRKNFAEN